MTQTLEPSPGRDEFLSLAERYPVPNAFRDLALLVSEFHTHCHRVFELRPKTLLKVFEKTDAFRRPERFEQFVVACEADARGRTGLEDRRYEQASYIRAAFAAASSVDAASIAGDAPAHKIPAAIRRARKHAITEFKASAV